MCIQSDAELQFGVTRMRVGNRTYKVLSGVRKKRRCKDNNELWGDITPVEFTDEFSSRQRYLTIAGRILNFTFFNKVKIQVERKTYPVTVSPDGYYRIDQLPYTLENQDHVLLVQGDNEPSATLTIRVPGRGSVIEGQYDIWI
jgi:hypothetical protein